MEFLIFVFAIFIHIHPASLYEMEEVQVPASHVGNAWSVSAADVLEQRGVDTVMMTASDPAVSEAKLEQRINRNGANVLSGFVDVFAAEAKKHQIDPAFLVAISVSETEYGTSNLLASYNNVGGIRCVANPENKKIFGITGCVKTGYGDFAVFSSVEQSIAYKAFLLKEFYVSKNLLTIEQIGSKYAPEADNQDKDRLNSYWVQTVSWIYADIRK